jgi:hypothetical protein
VTTEQNTVVRCIGAALIAMVVFVWVFYAQEDDQIHGIRGLEGSAQAGR